MKFSTKIFASIASVGVLSSATSSYLLYEAVRKNRETEFLAQYQNRVQLLGESFATIEDSYEVIGERAADAVIDWMDHHHQVPSGTELENLKTKLKVSDIRFIDITSGAHQGGLFERCPTYKKLFESHTLKAQTPLVPDPITGEVYSHTLKSVPNSNRVVEIRTNFAAATQIIKNVIKVDPEIERIDFYSPSNSKLGTVSVPDSEIDAARKIEVSYQAQASRDECCECTVQGLNAKDQGFFYRFVATVSMSTFDAGLQQLRWIFSGVLIFFTLLSIGLGRWLTTYLLRKIRKISDVVEDITLNQDFSRRIEVQKTNDELELLSERFNHMFDSAEQAQKKELEAQRDHMKAQVASEVAHDIRSPLTSMAMTLDQLVRTEEKPSSYFGEAISTLRHGIQRVNSIVTKLSRAHGVKTSGPTVTVEQPRLTLIDHVIKQVVLEQRARIDHPERIQLESPNQNPTAWAVIQLSEVQSAFSNIITNALEALDEKDSTARVLIQMNQDPNSLKVKISDNGIGMSPEVLTRIFERNFTYGKTHGNGLGLDQAKKAIEWSGGEMTVESTLGEGTTFLITLPLDEAPTWFSNTVTVKKGPLIFIDDDPTTLSVWKSRSHGIASERTYFYSSLSDFKAALPELPENAVIVIDQYIGNERGLDFIAQSKLKSFYLCTSEFDDQAIQNKVLELGVHLIPKPSISAIQFKEQP